MLCVFHTSFHPFGSTPHASLTQKGKKSKDRPSSSPDEVFNLLDATRDQSAPYLIIGCIITPNLDVGPTIFWYFSTQYYPALHASPHRLISNVCCRETRRSERLGSHVELSVPAHLTSALERGERREEERRKVDLTINEYYSERRSWLPLRGSHR